MRTLIAMVVVAVFLELPSHAEGTIQLTISDGQVWLVASEATVGQVLAEWARVGQTRILNADHLSTEPLTLQLAGVPESRALEMLLRSAAAGFVARRRSVEASNNSRFDQILIQPSSQVLAAAPSLTAAIGPAGSAGAISDPADANPEERLSALDAWSRNPGASLDPVTSALVDPDERVRARAQELFDEVMAQF
jgi:hypothetical protein